MFETKLPYDMDKMNYIKENGAKVDMSNIDFPNLNDDIRVSYIYLRNTDFNVELDFSKCNYEFKKQFVYFYLFGDIVYNFDCITDTWISIMLMFNDSNIDIPKEFGILSKEEIIDFINEYKDKIKIINDFLFSLCMYPILRLKDIKLNSDDIEINDEKIFNENCYNIIKNKYFNILLTFDGISKPVNFTKYFTNENNELFELIAKYTPYQELLYGLFNSSENDWYTFIDNINKTNAIIENIKK